MLFSPSAQTSHVGSFIGAQSRLIIGNPNPNPSRRSNKDRTSTLKQKTNTKRKGIKAGPNNFQITKHI